MGVIYTKTDQSSNVSTGTGVPTHSAVAGDRYTNLSNGNTYQYTTSWQQVAYGAGGLTYFTEAQSTASPNATINVDSLTAVASTTNADLVIRPKGTGALLANIPDNTDVGGNKRGTNAVDFQTTRGAATRVASGYQSCLLGGYNNTASGYQSSVLGGTANNSTGTYSIAGGSTNIAGTDGDVAFGVSNTTNGVGYNMAVGAANTISGGYYSIALGGYNSLTGYRHFASGSNNLLTSTWGSTILGCYGSDNGFSRLVYSGRGSAVGDTQSSKILLNKRTTDATVTALVSQYGWGSAVASNNQLVLQNNSSIRFKGTIIGRQSGSTNTSAWDIDGIIQQGTTAGSTTLLISNVNVVQNTPAWGTPTLAANTSLGCLTVNVTGAATTNIQWTCSLDTTEVIYA